MNGLVSLILAAVLILGGGATAAAAQDDLPNQPLYPVKLMTENARMALTGDPQEKANLSMHMAQTRVEEMAGLAEQGVPAPTQVHERLRAHIQQTLMLAADMDDPALTQTLTQLREQLRTQERIMQQLQNHADGETEPLLTRTRQMLQNRLMLVEQGLADPQGFRYMMANQMQYGQNDEIDPEPNQQGEPGFHQNDQAGQPDNGNENQNQNQNENGQNTDPSGNQNQNNSQNGTPNNQEQGNQEQHNSSNGPGDGTSGGTNQGGSDNGSSGNQDQGGQQDDNGSGGGEGSGGSGGGSNGGGGEDSGGGGGGSNGGGGGNK